MHFRKPDTTETPTATRPLAPPQDRVTFAVVVCVISVGHAGRYFYARREESLQTVPVLQTRLLREVWSFTKELLQDVSLRACLAHADCRSSSLSTRRRS